MSTAALKTIIKLRKDTLENFKKVADIFIPVNGEVCIVDTKATGLRIKVGDGLTSFGSLPYIDEDSSFKKPVVIGIYRDGKFYANTASVVPLELFTRQLYVDYIKNAIYYYDGSALNKINVDIPLATATTAGIVKLYTGPGNNTDGTITQKVFTDAIDEIQFGLEGSDVASECLVLKKPW